MKSWEPRSSSVSPISDVETTTEGRGTTTATSIAYSASSRGLGSRLSATSPDSEDDEFETGVRNAPGSRESSKEFSKDPELPGDPSQFRLVQKLHVFSSA